MCLQTTVALRCPVTSFAQKSHEPHALRKDSLVMADTATLAACWDPPGSFGCHETASLATVSTPGCLSSFARFSSSGALLPADMAARRPSVKAGASRHCFTAGVRNDPPGAAGSCWQRRWGACCASLVAWLAADRRITRPSATTWPSCYPQNATFRPSGREPQVLRPRCRQPQGMALVKLFSRMSDAAVASRTR